MSKRKGLLFDLDGVIVDTAKYHYLAWKEIAEELGVEFTLQDNERLKGVSRSRSFEIILEIGSISMPADQQAEYCARKNEIYLTYIDGLTKAEILPGVEDFLSHSRSKGYKIALGSASKNSERILKKLGLLEAFDIIVDGTKVEKAKPDPEVFIKGAEGLGVRPEECIVFEDAGAGIQAAKTAGMISVGVGNRETMGLADYFISGFSSLTISSLELAFSSEIKVGDVYADNKY